MNSAIAWWARNPVASNLLMLGLMLAGIISFFQMEREVLPTLALKQVTISAVWPGAGPKEINEQIVSRIEQSLKDLDSIERVTSTSYPGVGQVVVEASPKTDIATFINNIKLRVDAINSFPTDLEPLRVVEEVIRTPLISIALYGEKDELELKHLAQTLRDSLARLPSVVLPKISGAKTEEVTIELSEKSMDRYHLSFDSVADAIRRNSLDVSGGHIESASGNIQLRLNKLSESQQDFKDIIIHQSELGGIVRVGDVATVIDRFDDQFAFTTFNGQPALLLEVMSSDKNNVLATSEEVKKWLKTTQENLPDDVYLTLWLDSAETFESRMSSLTNSTFYGLLLVFGVLMLALRTKVALWVTGGIAVSYIASFILMPAYGVSINILSTFAFLLVLGIVVDDAIVVGESIHNQTDDTGKGDTDGAILGAQLVAKPVLYAVLTSIVAFLPWFFVTGEDAQITKQIAYVVVFALAFSLVEAFFILPAHLSKLKPLTNLNRLEKLQQRISKGMSQFAHVHIRRWLNWITENSSITTSLFVSMFVISIGLMTSGWVKFSFAPKIDKDSLSFNVSLPAGTPQERVIEVFEQIQLGAERVEQYALTLTDNTENKLIANQLALVSGENIRVTLKLTPVEERPLEPEDAAIKWRELIGEIPEANKVELVFNSNRKPGLELFVNHEEPAILRAAVDDLKSKLSTYEALYDVRDNLQSVSEELHFELKPGAEQLGLTNYEVLRQVRQAYYGEEAQRLPRKGNDVKVMVRYPKKDRTSLMSLNDFRISTPDGRRIPLLSVASVTYMQGVTSINRINGQQAVSVSADLKDSVAMKIVVDLEKNFLEDWQARHPGVTIISDGDVTKGEEDFVREILSLYVIALFLIYALIATAFKSYTMPLIVLSAVPFGLAGAIWGHFIYDMPLNLFSYFGIGTAVGVVINDNLVMIDAFNRFREQHYNMKDAIIEAIVQRFRPIVLTSLTTFVGLLPMMSETSVQAQFLQPTVIAMAFGVLFAGFVTIFFVPALLMLSFRISTVAGTLRLGKHKLKKMT